MHPYEDLWQRLVAALDEWTSATVLESGRLEVALPPGAADGPTRRVVVVMTPDEWDDMASVMWGDVDDAIEDVKRTLERLGPEQHFAVYDDYRLEPSTGPVLPPDPAEARMEELRRQHPEGFGRWSAEPP